MCPVCISTAVMMAAGITATAGVTTLVATKLLRAKTGLKAIFPSSSSSQKEKPQ